MEKPPIPWKINKKKEKPKAQWAEWMEEQIDLLQKKNHFNTVKKII